MKTLRKTLCIIVILNTIICFSNAKSENIPENPFLHDDNFPAGYFLLPDALPHFMGVYLKQGGMQKIEPTEEQRAIIQEKFTSMVSYIMPTATKVRELEAGVCHAVVYEGKTAAELKPQLDEIAELRRELTERQIDCLIFFKKTLTPEQYNTIIDLAITCAKHE
jgi:Spy/CpxP family protein refolding chaperone